ncbi:hypothetical protein B0H66DRAFT_144315 [Apodospora peruviana]|uniref:Uncharacterized protein n=1 Tax=Apodospora peruviana TaxID=516989 RepID=A0AAE0IIX8_9PEZI|nr:hypothetical protein B0H66DRAFT_144315 [Apodospora peruviana]
MVRYLVGTALFGPLPAADPTGWSGWGELQAFRKFSSGRSGGCLEHFCPRGSERWDHCGNSRTSTTSGFSPHNVPPLPVPCEACVPMRFLPPRAEGKARHFRRLLPRHYWVSFLRSFSLIQYDDTVPKTRNKGLVVILFRMTWHLTHSHLQALRYSYLF